MDGVLSSTDYFVSQPNREDGAEDLPGGLEVGANVDSVAGCGASVPAAGAPVSTGVGVAATTGRGAGVATSATHQSWGHSIKRRTTFKLSKRRKVLNPLYNSVDCRPSYTVHNFPAEFRRWAKM